MPMLTLALCVEDPIDQEVLTTAIKTLVGGISNGVYILREAIGQGLTCVIFQCRI